MHYECFENNIEHKLINELIQEIPEDLKQQMIEYLQKSNHYKAEEFCSYFKDKVPLYLSKTPSQRKQYQKKITCPLNSLQFASLYMAAKVIIYHKALSHRQAMGEASNFRAFAVSSALAHQSVSYENISALLLSALKE